MLAKIDGSNPEVETRCSPTRHTDGEPKHVSISYVEP
jgi:hypothetical protein